MSCPICWSDKPYPLGMVHDDRYGYAGEFPLMRCPECDHSFLTYELSPPELIALYTNYYPRRTFDVDQFKPYTAMSGWKAWFDGLDSSAFRWVPKNVRVLDVGCGFGESLAYHTDRGCDAYGVEADENIRRVVAKFAFDVHVGLFDSNRYDEEFFDFVTMDQVIEHVPDPLSLLSGIARILKPGGTAVLSTPNGRGWGAKTFHRRWINWHAPYHLQLFSKKSMRLAAKQAGLSVQIKTITTSEWLCYQWLHLITYPRIGMASSFWNPNTRMTGLQKFAARLAWLLHATKLNHLVTRLFDWVGAGDNMVVFLKKS